MTDGPMAKKARIWNPAVSDLSEYQDEQVRILKTQEEEEEESTDDKPLDCTSKNSQIPFPEVLQNYLQLAPLMIRFQQQRQIEEIARRQFLSTLCHVASPQVNVPQITVPLPPASSLRATSSSSTSSSNSNSSTGGFSGSAANINNPLVATALGSSLVNENCCAVCGAVFRLTGDLVQHMRNNHRKSKFKRKSDLRQ